MIESAPLVQHVAHMGDVSTAVRLARELAAGLGFDETAAGEIAIAASELASNMVRHAGGGLFSAVIAERPGGMGVRLEAVDAGPGIADLEMAFVDGQSSGRSLGTGLGAVNRLMDEIDVCSANSSGIGTRIVCARWLSTLPLERVRSEECPLSFGVASRPHPSSRANGDTFLISRWPGTALVAVIDGLGHGEQAALAATAAREFVARHARQPLDVIFQGTGRACSATRGVVMALARFSWAPLLLEVGAVGNVEIRAKASPEPLRVAVRRGVVGLRAPKPVVSQHAWQPGTILVLHSDGVSTHWKWDDFPSLSDASPEEAAHLLLRSRGKNDDDATVLVVKDAP